MWLFTQIGFFSVVQKPQDSFLTVRARVSSDLDRLRQLYMPQLSETVTSGGTDYPYRATISHADFAQGLALLGRDIHYPNFKSEIAKEMGHDRELVYSKVWSILQELENEPQITKSSSSGHRSGFALAYGGVVINNEGKILLREPRNHFDGYVWTFPKGRPNPGETPEETALREVLEETGIIAKIEKRIPGTFTGGTTQNIFFLMSYQRDTEEIGEETQAICWATPEEAQSLIIKTTNPVGRTRDLDILGKILELGLLERPV